MHSSLWAIARRSSACRQHIPNMTDDTKNILLNKEVIATDQDKAGHRGDRVMTEGPLEVWMRPLADGSKAIAIVNCWTVPLTLDVAVAKFGLRNAPFSAGDVWEHQDLPAARGTYHAEASAHGRRNVTCYPYLAAMERSDRALSQENPIDILPPRKSLRALPHIYLLRSYRICPTGPPAPAATRSDARTRNSRPSIA
jgi:hypothetical protein